MAGRVTEHESFSKRKGGTDALLLAASVAAIIVPAPLVFQSGAGWSGWLLLLLLKRSGPVPALAGALAAASAGVWLGDRPLLAFLVVLEVAVLAAWLKRGRDDLYPAELGYQLFIAAPAAALFCAGWGIDADEAIPLIAGGLVIGAANALIADLLHHRRSQMHMRGAAKADADVRLPVPLRAMAARLTAAVLLVPALLLIVIGSLPEAGIRIAGWGGQLSPASLALLSGAAVVLLSPFGLRVVSGRIGGEFEQLAAYSGVMLLQRRQNEVPRLPGNTMEAVELAANLHGASSKLNQLYEESERLTDALREQTARLRASEAALERLSYNDTVTTLPNRVYFYERLRSLMEERLDGTTVGVMLLDIDRFKQVNDSLGHASGDELLRIVAARLRTACGHGPVICRLGGDEFAVLLPEGTRESLSRLGDAILEALAEPVRVGGRDLYVSTSIGISLCPDDAQRVEELVRNADTAMYTAKEAGGRRYEFYYDSMKERVSERLEMETSLHKALEQGQFELFYQPKMNADGTCPVGFEALIRWRRPGRGYVPPDLFIPLAEETGVIQQLGDWVLRNACRQNVEWQRAGYPPVIIAVNVSPRQFENPMFVERIEAILEETGLQPEWLELEITESFLQRDKNVVIGMLRRLKDRGIRISIDDFGTGYSSLSQLKSLPIHAVKIDRTFIRRIDTDRKNASIVSAIAALARSMNLCIVAEGVETEAEHLLLREMRCDELQGYYFSKPLRAEDVVPFLELVRQHAGAERRSRESLPHDIA